MTPQIESLIQEIENETIVNANSKTRIGNVLREISNEKKYKSFIAKISQNNTSQPTVVIALNEIGNITISRLSVGRILVTLESNNNPNFNIVKRFANIGNSFYGSLQDLCKHKATYRFTDNYNLEINTYFNDVLSDDVLNANELEIRVYN